MSRQCTLFSLPAAERLATERNTTAPTELSYEVVMRPDCLYVVACIEQTPDGAKLRGYL